MLLHMDGFDSYATGSDLFQEYTIATLGIFSTSAGRFGGGAVYLNDNGKALYWTNPNVMTEIWSGCAVKIDPSYLGPGFVFTFTSGAGTEAGVWYDWTTGYWACYKGNQSTFLGSAPYPISMSFYHWVEVHYKISTTVGVMEVWVDGVQVINLTGINTSQSGGTNFGTVGLGLVGSNTCRAVYDDWYILDTTGSYNNTRLGDSRIETLRPNSDAGPNDGVPSTAGPHYAMVDEMQWSTSNTIVLGSTSGNAEVFGMTSLSTAPSTIHAVRVLAVVEKTDGGTLLANAIVVSSNVEADGTSTDLNTSFSHAFNMFETDPNTSTPWTATAVNSMNCGFKVP